MLFAQNEFNLRVQFAADNYGQLMQGRLLMFKPTVIAPRRQLNFREENRKAPIVLYAETYRHESAYQAPRRLHGRRIAERRETGRSALGTSSVAYKVNGGELLADQELKTDAVTLPPDDYPEVRKFFGAVQAAEQQPVVLVKN